MSKIIQLNKKKHLDYNLHKSSNYLFSQKDNICPIIMAEISHVLQQAPIVFVKNSADEFGLYMLQGFIDQTNNFCNKKGNWLGTYVPARYRQYPFSAIVPSGEKNLNVFFDQDSKLISKNKTKQSIPLFDEKGELTEHIKNVMSFLIGIESGKKRTQEIVTAIERYSLLEPWNVKVKTQDKEIEVKGLWTINKKNLTDLTAKGLADLHKLNAFELIYAHFFSLGKLQNVGNLTTRQTDDNVKSLKDRAIDKQKEKVDKEVDSLVKNLLDGD